MANSTAPHRAVIWLQAEVHELNNAGECSGNPTMKVPQFVLAIDGEDKAITERKLNEFIAELKERCKLKK